MNRKSSVSISIEGFAVMTVEKSKLAAMSTTVKMKYTIMEIITDTAIDAYDEMKVKK
jgi:hypothetical protein